MKKTLLLFSALALFMSACNPSRRFFRFKVVSILLVFAIILQIGLQAEEQPKGDLTLATLRSLKAAALEKKRENFNKDLAKLVAAVPADEPVIIKFIKSDLINSQKAYNSEELVDFDRFTDKMLVVLERIGSAKSVPVLIDWLATRKWSEDVCPLGQAKTLLIISERVPVTKDQLKPLLGSKDPEMAKLAKEIWNIICYKDIPSDIENVVYSGVSNEKYLVQEAGVMDNWEALAKERGYDLSEKNRTASLVKLIIDTKKRLTEMQTKYQKGKIKREGFIHSRCREQLLRLRALQNLMEWNRKVAFDILVEWLDKPDASLNLNAAYFLFELTGKSFPINAYFDYGNIRNKISVNRKAAVSWREWRKKHSDIPIPEKSTISLQKRLSAFQLDQRRKDGGEFKRPVEDVISELLTSKDRRILKMLVKVLAAKTLTKNQVKRVINAAKTDDSEEHRKYLLQVLSMSGDSSGKAYIVLVINASTPENTVIEYVKSLNKFGTSEIDLLENLYSKHKSGKVRDAIVQRVFATDYLKEIEKDAQNRFAKFLLVNSKNNEDKLFALRVVCNRAGVNRSGRKLIFQALESEKTPKMRQGIFEMLMERDADDALPILLSPEEPENIKLAGLTAYQRKLKNDPPDADFIDDEIRILRQGKKDNASAKVQKAITEIIGIFREAEIDEQLKRLRGRSIASAIQEQLKRRNLSDAEKKAMKRQFEFMRKQFEGSVFADNMIKSLKQKYGDLPEEKEIRTKLEKSRKKQLSEIDKALNLIK